MEGMENYCICDPQLMLGDAQINITRSQNIISYDYVNDIHLTSYAKLFMRER